MGVELQTYLTIEEIAVWARCRDRDVVNLLGTPALDGRHAERNEYLDLRMRHAAMEARARGRNIERELWDARAMPVPLSSLIAPRFALEGAEVSNDAPPPWLALFEPALAEAYEKALLSVQRRVADALDLAAAGRSELEPAAGLPAPFDALIGNVLAARRGGVNAFGYLPIFPVADYLLELLRDGRFKAAGNLPGEPLSRELSVSDWHGLTIALASDTRRLRVWRLGNDRRFGDGDIENVQIGRDAVLKEFPADPPPPEATEDNARRVIREAMASNGGFISQKNGAKIVRAVFPDFNVARAMELTKELTGNAKSGPRGPRKKLSE